MREALARLVAGRVGWLWLMLEPVAHVGILMVLFTVIQRGSPPGTDVALFVGIGLLGYKFFVHPGMRSASAISANRGLMGYRQVRPVDTVLVRAALEGVINVFVAIILVVLAGLAGLSPIPSDPIQLVRCYLLIWIFGAGFGLVVSASSVLIPEIEKVVRIVSIPLYFASAVLYSLANLPPLAQEWLLYNPLVHGLELARAGYFTNYHLVAGVSEGYLASFAVGSVLAGLVLHRRFSVQLAAR